MQTATQAVVLLVHDDLAVCIRLGKLLSAMGHATLGPASNVDQALGLLDHITPDAALLGWHKEETSTKAAIQRLLDLEMPFALISDDIDAERKQDSLPFVPRIGTTPDEASFRRFFDRLIHGHPPGVLAAIASGAIVKGSANLH